MIPAEEAPLKYSTHTHPGLKGKQNEDRIAVQAYEANGRWPLSTLFAVLADGVGEHRAGEVAAEITVESVSQFVGRSDGSQPRAILQAAIYQASQNVLFASETDSEKEGMGSTCLCAWVINNRLYTAAIGNSRLYLLRGNRLQRLNVVHEMALEENTEQDKVGDDVRVYLGSRHPVEVDQRLILREGAFADASERHQGLALHPNDRLLLASDGLTAAVQPEEIQEVLANTDIDEAAKTLVDLAIKLGAPGNCSAIVLAVPPGHPPAKRRQLPITTRLTFFFVLTLLVALAGLGWFFNQGDIGPIITPANTPIATLTALPTNTPIP